MIISITAILALVSLVPAIPVDGDIFARSSTDGKLDTRMGAIFTTLDLRSENPSERALTNLESRDGTDVTDAAIRKLDPAKFSSQKYLGFHGLIFAGTKSAQSICSSTNAGEACEDVGTAVFYGLEAILLASAIFWSGDIEHGIFHIAGVWGFGNGVTDFDASGLTTAAYNYVLNFLETGGAASSKRSLPGNEHDEVDFTSDTSIDGRPGLTKRDSSQFGLKFTMSAPGKLPNDRSLITDLAHGFAKQWGETAFSQTGWSDYYSGLKDSDGNTILEFRITPSEGKPSSENAVLP